MYLQEAIEKVAARLKQFYFDKDNDLSEGFDGCAYRGMINGKETRCAVGCLMPNYMIPEKWEGLSIAAVYNRFHTDIGGVLTESLKVQMMAHGMWPTETDRSDEDIRHDEVVFVEFLSRMQIAHDNAVDYNNKEVLKKELQTAFKEAGLTW